MTTISALAETDREEWLPLWAAYIAFYASSLADDVTATTFARFLDPDVPMHAAIARDDDGRAIGFVHWLEHSSTWSRNGYTYLEDLFVDPASRGGGVGEALIAHVSDSARAVGSDKVYWLTAETNTTARRLYDRVARRSGFLHYERELG